MSLKILCGPNHDERIFTIELPPQQRLGVMVSGGIDSTLLYYLLQYLKKRDKTDHYIRPLVIPRLEGSKFFAKPIVKHVHALLELPDSYPTIVGNNTLPEPKQVESGVIDAFKYLKLEAVYIGAIDTRPEHLLNYDRPVTLETHEVKFPFLHLEKSHVIDLYYKLGVENLLPFTHSCDQHETIACGKCNGCVEKAWGFNQLNISY